MNKDLRIRRLRNRAIEVLGDAKAADDWLRSPIKGLGYKKPLVLVDTEQGTEEVENMLGRIEDGIFS